MRKIIKIILLLLLILGYVYVINNFIEIIYPPEIYDFQNKSIFMDSQDVSVGFGEHIDVTITRKRFYGTIIEKDENSMVYLFGILPLPIKQKGFYFVPFHIAFLLIIVYIILWIFYERGDL